MFIRNWLLVLFNCYLFCIFAACHKLISSEEGKLPNAFVEIRTMTPPATTWSKHAQTEIIEVSVLLR